MTELLTDARLRAALGARPFQLLMQTDSTNDLARQWALAGAPTGAVVIAEEQTSGRGRFERRWLAPPATALLMSVVLRPALSAERLARAAMIGALAAAECLDQIGVQQVAIKWPNDVQIGGLKTVGVLPEALWQNDRLQALIIGIGVNVRVDFVGSPLEGKATSVETALNHTVDRALLCAQLLRRVDHWSVRLNDPALLTSWRARLNTLGQYVTASAMSGTAQPISGRASDVDADGALLVTDSNGSIHRLIAGEVTLSDNRDDTTNGIANSVIDNT